jgi:protein SCO1
MSRPRALPAYIVALFIVACTAGQAFAQSAPADAREPIPDIAVLDQTGRTLNFYSDLVKGNVVAVNFVFTSCRAICPQLGATSAALSRDLAKFNDPRYRVISVSIDPDTDTPERLRAWSAHFGAAPGWTLVTGNKRDIETLQRALQVYSADKDLHSGSFLLGDASTDTWKRVAGTTPPARLADAMHELTATDSAAAAYFPDVPLVDQHGNSHRFYSDLIKGRIVVINTFFADCSAVCPMTLARLAKIQAQFGDRVGKDVFLYSITVDAIADTPEKLGGYARRYGAGNGWQFLSGEKTDVDLVLRKIGQFVDNRDSHSSLFIIGNEPSGLWKKANGLAAADEIAEVVASVANDGR